MSFLKRIKKALSNTGKKAYKAATGKDMPTTPYYGRITPPTMIDRPLFTPRAAPPPPPKKKKGLWDTFTDNVRSVGRSIDNAVTQPIVNQVKQAGTAIDKKVIQPVSTSKTMKSIQKAAQKGADSAGDVFRGEKDIYGNSTNRQAKSKVENTTPLVDDGSAQQKAAREMEAEMAKQKAMSGGLSRQQGMTDRMIDKSFDRDIRAGKIQPMSNPEWENKVANTIKTIASGGSAILGLPELPEEEDEGIEGTVEPIRQTRPRLIASGGQQLASPSAEGPDSDDVFPGGKDSTEGKNTIGVPTETKKSSGPTQAIQSSGAMTALTGSTPEQLYADFYSEFRDVASPLDMISYKMAVDSGDLQKAQKIINKVRSRA